VGEKRRQPVSQRVSVKPPGFGQSLRWLALMTLVFWAAAGLGDEPPEVKKTDRCPVCGMFVHKYPKWVGQIVFKDGSYYFYDGAKDLFKHLFNVPKYTPGKMPEGIKDIYVTDYYEVGLIPAKTALYVIGSDVLGPMGHELLPFKDRESAQEFLEDHKGKSVLSFRDVTVAIIESLDRRQ
jgi:copper chaperone NosL